ncbi:SET and MYND domain-containing protein 5 [Pseudocercospora fuligena]|uniref:SET and MYND domain-containing protein 5 n=1 Tax=Pseudocercospora fuligena TaxID=685502 RepID=A0A8H6VD59_9PEZI|nr:SET and MYND domain-containing protein 5 [Pseudocercospora fuligena]
MPPNLPLTHAQRELAASLLGERRSAITVDAVIAGDHDGEIAYTPELLEVDTCCPMPLQMRSKIAQAKASEQSRAAAAYHQRGMIDLTSYSRSYILESFETMAGPLGMPLIMQAEPYPPCVRSLHQLQSVQLSELRRETHHRGKMVIVRTISRLLLHHHFGVAAVEDESGSPRLMYFFNTQHKSGEAAMPAGTVLAVKEPYYTLDRSLDLWSIRSEHPNDVLPLSRNHSLVPLSMRMSTMAIDNKGALEWKHDGNVALRPANPGGYALAVHFYNKGLEKVSDSEITVKRDLLRNRAHANLQLSRFDAAKADAVASLILDSDADTELTRNLDYKAYRRAATAAYGLRQWATALHFISKCIEQCTGPAPADVVGLQGRIAIRVAELDAARYDWQAIIAGLPTRQRIDAADFVRNTEVKDTETHGRGLFAKQNIEMGGLILVEKAAHMLNMDDPAFYPALTYDASTDRMRSRMHAFWQDTVFKLTLNPSKIPAITSLYDGGYDALPEEGRMVDCQAIIDAFRIRSCLDHNTLTINTPFPGQSKEEFGFCREEPHAQGGGIWLRASMANHSCLFNAARSHIGDLIILRATKPIAAGEEILISYASNDNYELRQVLLEQQWGFTCDCPRCKAESEDEYEIRHRRAKLFQQFVQLKETPDPENRTKLKSLANQLLATFDKEKYDGLPHPFIIEVHDWLVNDEWQFQEEDNVMKAVQDLARACGFRFDIVGEQVHVKALPNSLLDKRLIHALVVAASVEAGIGTGGPVADQLRAIAYKLYVTLNGLENGWEEFCATIETTTVSHVLLAR